MDLKFSYAWTIILRLNLLLTCIYHLHFGIIATCTKTGQGRVYQSLRESSLENMLIRDQGFIAKKGYLRKTLLPVDICEGIVTKRDNLQRERLLFR